MILLSLQGTLVEMPRKRPSPAIQRKSLRKGFTRLRMLRRGFTLIELLLVIGIISVLAAVVITAINPSKQLGGARNSQRWAEVNTILNAYWQYAIDNGGRWQPILIDGQAPANCDITATVTKICKTDTTYAGASCGSVDPANCIWSRHLSGTYLIEIPLDPSDDESPGDEVLRADYTAARSASRRLTIAAPNAEQGEIISVAR